MTPHDSSGPLTGRVDARGAEVSTKSRRGRRTALVDRVRNDVHIDSLHDTAF